ncbi:MAG: hypothetical protein K2Y40_10145 [Reyranella sp.]|jgi:hypothetical protein|nr:hypothetical protein [Reyranella sp.]
MGKKVVHTRGAGRSVAIGRLPKALAGRATRGTQWDPTQISAMAPAAAERNESRPYTTRYPISNEAFEKLKANAPQARLRKATAQQVRDSNRSREELGARPMSLLAASPELQPSAAPTGAANFAGLTATGWRPPDCTMAVGPLHVLVSVNSSVAIYTKTGAIAVQPRTLTDWFANVVQRMTIFDPKALYDQHEGRWVLLAVAFQNSPKKSLYLLSISDTADPLGPWKNFALDAMKDGVVDSNFWADFPGLGVDSQALYVTSNQFAFDGGFQYAKIRVISKVGLYSGGAVPFYDFVRMQNADGSMAFTVQPCHTFGAPQAEYLVNTRFPAGKTLTLWRITNPTAATPTLARQEVAVSPYQLAPNAEQNGGAPPLNTGDVRALHAVFRGGTVWTSFTTAHNWGGSNKASVQWCEVNPTAPSVIQQGVYGATGSHSYFPALCPDNNGNMILVFSRSSTTEFGSIYYTGRRASDPLGTLQNSTLLKAGVAHYVGTDSHGRNRWGDYNGIAADPAVARQIWFYSEFASAPNTWATWIGSAFF